MDEFSPLMKSIAKIIQEQPLPTKVVKASVRYVVTWCCPGNMGSKIYKYYKPAMRFVRILLICVNIEIWVEKQVRIDDKWTMTARWVY